MANTIDWGKATQNNTNGFGKYQNTINAGDIYANSYAGETVIVGTSAAFSYSKSSYHQGEADPTPTITGTTGGSFVCTSGAVFVDTGSTSSSTGQIDLDASTIDTHLISYTVDGVTATANVGITVSPFLSNTFSMQFDGVDDYIDLGTPSTFAFGTGDFSISSWVYLDSSTGYQWIFSTGTNFAFGFDSSRNLQLWVGVTATTPSFNINLNQWHHVVATRNSGTVTFYIDGVAHGTTYTRNGSISSGAYNYIGTFNIGQNHINGKLDETAIWNTALSSDAVTEIYNATNNNSGKVLDLLTDSGNYSSSSNLQYWNRLGD